MHMHTQTILLQHPVDYHYQHYFLSVRADATKLGGSDGSNGDCVVNTMQGHVMQRRRFVDGRRAEETPLERARTRLDSAEDLDDSSSMRTD